ncbi:MAG: energy-coupling factor transporter transmembrane component T [Acidobacteriota bacterium]
MHHRVIDQWSRGVSPLHALSAGVKLAALLGILIAISAAPTYPTIITASGLLTIAAMVSGLPFTGLLSRAAFVLPFTAIFALLTWWSGDPERALLLVAKSFLSGFAAVLFAATTPLAAWTNTLRRCRFPSTLVTVIEFLYRYLFVVAQQAETMRWAARGRGGFRFDAAGGAVGALFARSWQRADGIHRAMLARGFQGTPK